MSIKSRLNIIVLLSVVTIAGLYGYIVKITLDIDHELAQIEKVEEFEDSVSKLGVITEYYISNEEERYITAWITLIDRIELLSVQIEDFHRYQIVGESIPSIRNAFELIVQINNDPEMYPESELRSELLDRATTRIRSDVRQLTTLSYRVSEDRLENIRALQVDQRLDYLFFLIPVILAIFVLAYFMRRLIVTSINKLQEGTQAFADGKFNQRIGLDGDDELGELATQFNKMADELENRIENEKQLNQMLELQAEELKSTNEELENFASVASHDLKEPLRMIHNFMELLKKKYAGQLDETANKYIHFAIDGSHRMTNLIEELLDFSRAGKLQIEFEDVDTERMLEELIQNFEPEIEEKSAIIKYNSLPTVRVVPVSLKMVFQNLIRNALKYHKEGAIPEIEIYARELTNHWQFSVKDNGIGIEEEYHDQVFQIFKRLHEKEEYPGTGMGLATCKKIVEQHEGRIWVESKPGKGSTFHFTIAKQSPND